MPFLPHISFPPCRTKVLIFSALACMLECNWCTRILVWTLHSLNPALDFECGCVCPQTGQVHSYSVFLPLFWFLFRLAPLLMWLSCWPLFSGFFCSPSSSWCGVSRGLCLLAFHLRLPALAVSFCRVSFGLCASLWSLLGVLRGFYCLSSLVFGLFLLLPLFFVPCSVVLLVFVLGVWGCCGVTRSLMLPPSCPSPLG